MYNSQKKAHGVHKGRIKCRSKRSDDECRSEYPFNSLPFVTVDEQIYNNPPSLLIGMDKFAQVTRENVASTGAGGKTTHQTL